MNLHQRLGYSTRLFLSNDLRFIEKRLRTITDILESDTYEHTFSLYSMKSDIDLETKNKVLYSIKKIQNHIQQLQEKFGLEKDVESLKRRIDVYLEEIWTTVADTRPEKMLGYGKMSQSDEDSTSTHVLKLPDMAEHLLFNKPI